ncbi:hypothetical protein HPB48_019152 [Haemaphysalis longicornis]|uniref:Isopropylmalate dehydrogenase-like domain-containing protein n=1 Tax=Haemaphysalis longicornis TaxID=44386 RepID=A0A9J6G3J3_HAELO|nr:hypothetical protein HPB48_019152 [Haemaphysalis longicornis]
MEKLKCGPVVEMRGDDMARVVWDLVREKLIEPYVQADLNVFDLSIENRNTTNDAVTLEAADALKTFNVGVKCATITAEKDVLEKYHLKRMFKSPNAAIRNALGGAVFREPIVCRNIPPLVKQWRKPIIHRATRVRRPVQRQGLRCARTRHTAHQVLAHNRHAVQRQGERPLGKQYSLRAANATAFLMKS